MNFADARIALLFALATCAAGVHAAWSETQPRTSLTATETPVREPGKLDKPGTTYVLTQDIQAPGTVFYLGKDIVLDLNGHTITYCAGPYEHIPNHGFEDGLKGWDVSKAPNAKVLKTAETLPLVGEHLCSLPGGSELVSPYITIPVANRSYYAMVALAKQEMRVSIGVDDEKGQPVRCIFKFGANERQSCPEPNRSPKLGGGFVFAHLHGLPAGKYRLKIKAETDCLIDEADIRPALDAGLAVVEQVLPWAYYKCILDGDSTAFFDCYGREKELPNVTGPGAIIIKNGIIKSGFKAIRTWGLQSTAKDVKLKIENVKFIAEGINTNAIDVPDADLTNCRFEIDTPFIIDRHRQQDYPVHISNAKGSIIQGCEWVGGQGGLSISGSNAEIKNNVFRVKQTVTNHYCIGPGGNGHKIHHNLFEPQMGSGIYVGRSKNVEVFENEFKIVASPPICEYAHTDYSVSAVRLSDYNAKPGNGKGVCADNSVYKNKIQIIGRDYPQARASAWMKNYQPRAYGFFISVGGGTNKVYENEITLIHEAPESTHAEAYAFFIGGSDNGGEIYKNRVSTNVPAFWIASSYGPASNTKIYENTVIRPADCTRTFKPVRMGCGSFLATQIEFSANRWENLTFGVDATDKPHVYKVQ